MMVDVHTHTLFQIDDGPKTWEESILLLQELASSGVSDIVATSHFYSNRMPADQFIKNRNDRLLELRNAVCEKHLPIRLYGGAEVYLDKLIFNLNSLSGLCFENTNKVLLEIPHTTDDLDEVLQLIDRIMSYFNVQPIIAHVERYRFFYNKMRNLCYLHDMGCILQVDTDCFLSGFRDKMFAYKALKEGYVDVVASDCHNTSTRQPNLAEAYAMIRKKAGDEAVERLQANARQLLLPTDEKYF